MPTSVGHRILAANLFMGNWFTPELALAAVLAMSLTCGGLLALWAATASRHWFLRAAVFLAALSPLILVPAYEPLVAFIIQGAVVATGTLAHSRWQKVTPNANEPSVDAGRANAIGLRFSLSTLLLATALVAATTPVAAQLPALNIQAWYSTVAIGAAAGLVTLIAARMCTANRKLLALPIGLLLSFTIGCILWRIDWFVPSVVQQSGWPPTPPPVLVGGATPMPPTPKTSLTWPVVFPAMCLALFAILLPLRANVKHRFAARMFAGAIAATLAALPLSVLWQLLHPLPVPQVEALSHNGYDDFLAAGAKFDTSPILNTTLSPVPTKQLSAEVAKFSAYFDQVRRGLSYPCRAPVWPLNPDSMTRGLFFPDVQSIRGVARALDQEADLAQREQRFRDAVKISIDTIHVGEASTRGGVIIQYLVAIAIEGIGQWRIYLSIQQLDAGSCRETVLALEEIDKNREPFGDVLHNDRIFSEHAWEWYGHLLIILEDVAQYPNAARSATDHARRRVETVCRLLTLETALRQYKLETGKLPNRLEDLVPKYISKVPVDPFDADHSPMHYSKTADGYLLYSVGYNGVDDHGHPSTREHGWLDDGDMRLDEMLKDDDPQPAAGDQSNDSDSPQPAEPTGSKQ